MHCLPSLQSALTKVLFLFLKVGRQVAVTRFYDSWMDGRLVPGSPKTQPCRYDYDDLGQTSFLRHSKTKIGQGKSDEFQYGKSISH